MHVVTEVIAEFERHTGKAVGLEFLLDRVDRQEEGKSERRGNHQDHQNDEADQNFLEHRGHLLQSGSESEYRILNHMNVAVLSPLSQHGRDPSGLRRPGPLVWHDPPSV